MKTLIYQYFYEEKNSVVDKKDGKRVPRVINTKFNYHKLSKQSMSAYASSIGADYKMFDHKIPYSSFYGIFIPFVNKLCFDYDAVCFIDSDILATTTSQNIFEQTKDDMISVDFMRTGGHCNSGVVVFPKHVYNDFINHLGDLKCHYNNRAHVFGNMDQKIVNEFVLPNNYNDLGSKFNWMISRPEHYPPAQNKQQSFLHYHRESKSQMIKDFELDWIMK